MNYYGAFRTWLSGHTSPYVLSMFRILFGLFMTYQILDYFRIGLVRNMFVLPAINFGYDYLKWLKPLPEPVLNIILGLLLVCAVCIALGVFFKWACRIFALGYLYIFLLDKSIYNNHIYLFILLAFLLSFTDAAKTLSVTSRKYKVESIPNWQPFILQAQIIIVYFFGGIAKLKYDWLFRCEPIRTLIENIPDTHVLASMIKNDFGISLFNYGGLLLDLGAPLWLWNRRIRKWAIIPIILFHILNSIVFKDIGIFPFVMLVSLILFYSVDEIPIIRRSWGKVEASKKSKDITLIKTNSKPGFNKSYLYILIAFFIFQLLFPLRGYFLPNDMDWTTIGNRCAWRMKVDTREFKEITFTVMNNQGQTAKVEIQKLINDMQILNLFIDPRSSMDFAKMLQQEANEMNIGSIRVNGTIRVGYNGREPQNFINPNQELTSAEYSPFKTIEWVYPVQ